MTHRRQAPHQNRKREALARAEPIHHPPGHQQTDRIRRLKKENDPAVSNLIPDALGLKSVLKRSNYLPVEIINRRGKEQQRADGPTEIADARMRVKGGVGS